MTLGIVISLGRRTYADIRNIVLKLYFLIICIQIIIISSFYISISFISRYPGPKIGTLQCNLYEGAYPIDD